MVVYKTARNITKRKAKHQSKVAAKGSDKSCVERSTFGVMEGIGGGGDPHPTIVSPSDKSR